MVCLKKQNWQKIWKKKHGENETLKLGEYEDEIGKILGETREGNGNGVLTIKATPGNGTKSNPYIITTVEQLQALKILKNTEGIHIKLGNDIDLSGECSADIGNWISIGTEKNPFKGEFDGNGKSILNLYIANGTANVNTALFQYNEGTIKNLNITGTITSTQGASGIAYQNKGTIENCTNNINITNNSIPNAVGIAMYNYGTIKRCMNKGNVIASKTSAISTFAGIVGSNYEDGIIEECINSGIIEGYNSTAGIAGYNSGKIKRCINTGSISGSNVIGGIAGHNNGNVATIYNSYNTASVTGSSTGIGGIAGYNGYYQKSYIYNCYSINKTNIVGGTGNSSIALNCYTSGMTAENLNNGIEDIETNENTESPWQEDVTPNINNGYPILKWQI